MAIGPDTIRDVVLGTIASVGRVEPSMLTSGTNLLDLGFDSLDLANIVAEIEARAGRDVSRDLLDHLVELGEQVTVGDVVVAFEDWARLPAAEDRLAHRD